MVLKLGDLDNQLSTNLIKGKRNLAYVNLKHKMLLGWEIKQIK